MTKPSPTDDEDFVSGMRALGVIGIIVGLALMIGELMGVLP